MLPNKQTKCLKNSVPTNGRNTTSHRLTGFNYASDGAYFITIVTKNREHFFGEIVDNKMVLNELGKIARDEWFKTPEIRPDMNLTMVEFVVMPNHIHGVIYIGENKFNMINTDKRRRDAMHGVSTTMHGVSKMHGISQMHGLTDLNDDNYKNKFAPQRKNLSSIIRGYKSAVTKNSRKITPDFAWQRNYHDRIIRNDDELNRIREYIIYNPQMWERDRNNRGLWL